MTTVFLGLNDQQKEALDRLTATGLWGSTIEHTALRLLDRGLIELAAAPDEASANANASANLRALLKVTQPGGTFWTAHKSNLIHKVAAQLNARITTLKHRGGYVVTRIA